MITKQRKLMFFAAKVLFAGRTIVPEKSVGEALAQMEFGATWLAFALIWSIITMVRPKTGGFLGRK
jgi:hypothetical protein